MIDRDHAQLALPLEWPVAPAQAQLRLPGNLTRDLWCGRHFGCFSRATRGGWRYAQAASARPLPALVIPPCLTVSPVEHLEGTTEIRHHVTDLGQYSDGGNQIDARTACSAVTTSASDHSGTTRGSPAPLALRARFRAGPTSQAKHHRGDLLTLAAEVFLCGQTGARERARIASCSSSGTQNPDRSQFPSSRQLGQANRIASVGFYPITEFLRSELSLCRSGQHVQEHVRCAWSTSDGWGAPVLCLSITAPTAMHPPERRKHCPQWWLSSAHFGAGSK
jgi:hypothetical protein